MWVEKSLVLRLIERAGFTRDHSKIRVEVGFWLYLGPTPLYDSKIKTELDCL